MQVLGPGQGPLQGPPSTVPPGSNTEELLHLMIGHLDGIHQVLTGMLKELTDLEEQGIVLTSTFSTTGLQAVERVFQPGLFSINITNDGPGVIQYRIPINSASDWINLNPTETISFTFRKPKIKSAYFRAQAANGNIRLVGTL